MHYTAYWPEKFKFSSLKGIYNGTRSNTNMGFSNSVCKCFALAQDRNILNLLKIRLVRCFIFPILTCSNGSWTLKRNIRGKINHTEICTLFKTYAPHLLDIALYQGAHFGKNWWPRCICKNYVLLQTQHASHWPEKNEITIFNTKIVKKRSKCTKIIIPRE